MSDFALKPMCLAEVFFTTCASRLCKAAMVAALGPRGQGRFAVFMKARHYNLDPTSVQQHGPKPSEAAPDGITLLLRWRNRFVLACGPATSLVVLIVSLFCFLC